MQIAWVAHYLDDLESDFSAIHGVDMYDLDAARFFRMAWRMSAYKGVMRMRAMEQSRPDDRPGSTAKPQNNRQAARRRDDEVQQVSVSELMVLSPGLVEKVTV